MTDDPSRPESVPSSTLPEAVSLEKGVSTEGRATQPPAPQPLPTNQTQEGGSSPWADARATVATAGSAANTFQAEVNAFQPQSGQAAIPGATAQSEAAQKKLVAGLLGIFLGSLGIHKFYLGMNQPGIIMLACTIGGYVLFTLLAIILIGFIFLLVPAAVGLIGLIEGVIYLTKSDADFQREYLVGKKPWF